MKRLSIVFSIVVVLVTAVALAEQLATPVAEKKADKVTAKAVKPAAGETAKSVATIDIPAPPRKSASSAVTHEPAKKAESKPKTVAVTKSEPALAPAPKAEEKSVRVESKPAKLSQDAAYPGVSPGEVQMTPDVWAYQQAMRQDQESAQASRRAAEYRAEQRIRRIESRRWFGLSNQRPVASPDPFNGDYAPIWVSNYPFNPNRWVGMGY
jgi:hypothetical protein